MMAGPEAITLVSTIIKLAHSMNLNVVAEGVETDQQSRLLRLLKCDEIQGYLAGKPVSRKSFEARHLGTSAPAEAAGAAAWEAPRPALAGLLDHR
jgi:EAL domain-containing protein (putative c-di-GMP-specific phosphodiesterase class I)